VLHLLAAHEAILAGRTPASRRAAGTTRPGRERTGLNDIGIASV
jgi:hypothetical protein